jgi:hypothetical protein
VQTAKETVTVYTMAETKFVKSGVPASVKDLKVAASSLRLKIGGDAEFLPHSCFL